MKYLAFAAAAAVAAASFGLSTPASATGKMTCNAGPQSKWKSQDALKQNLTKKGWKVAKSKVDGGCYEVYGTNAKGQRVEAYFHPVTFEQLLVSQRGKVIFRKK